MTRHLPIAHFVTTMPEGNASLPSGISTSCSTCSVVPVDVNREFPQEGGPLNSTAVATIAQGLGRGNGPSAGSPTNDEDVREFALLLGVQRAVGLSLGPHPHKRYREDVRGIQRSADGAAFG